MGTNDLLKKKKDQKWRGGTRKEMFYLTMHSTHFIYGYIVSDIW